MNEKDSSKERRQYPRINKQFILSYSEKDIPNVKHEMSQLKNISMGGVCFLSSKQYPPFTKLNIELKTPYLDDTTHLEGTVLGSHEKVANVLYETRLQFEALSPQAKIVIEKIVEYYQKEKEL